VARQALPFVVALVVLGCGQDVAPTPEDITKVCLDVRGQRYVLDKLPPGPRLGRRPPRAWSIREPWAPE